MERTSNVDRPGRLVDAGGSASPLPGLDAAKIARLVPDWTDGGLWDDIGWLAGRFWSTSGDDHVLAWHHLVLAVGNFKRQPGRRLRPGRLAHLSVTSNSELRPMSFSVPDSDPPVVVEVEDSRGWRSLSASLPGAAEATTATLLAALWPDSHFVFDWRVHAAANALRIQAGLPCAPEINLDGADTPPLTFDDYRVLRGWVVGTARATGETVRAVERSLYRLSQLVPSAVGRTWRQYADEVGRTLSAVGG